MMQVLVIGWWAARAGSRLGVLKKRRRPAYGRFYGHAAPPNALGRRMRQDVTVSLGGVQVAECTVRAFDGGTHDVAQGFSTAPLSLLLGQTAGEPWGQGCPAGAVWWVGSVALTLRRHCDVRL